MRLNLNRPALIAAQIPLSELNPIGGSMDQYTAFVLNNANYVGTDNVEHKNIYAVNYKDKQYVSDSTYDLILKIREAEGVTAKHQPIDFRAPIA